MIATSGSSKKPAKMISDCTEIESEPLLQAEAQLAANDAGDPRLSDIIAAIERELTVGPHVYRYRMNDGLEGDEESFVACSFWLAGNWALQGRTSKASHRVTELIGCANDLGLFGEEIDSRTGEALGNFPQGFSHMALINGLVRLKEAVTRFGLI